MTLTDTGPLIALINRKEPSHEVCVRTLTALPLPMISTAPVLTETLYFLGSMGGWKLQKELWDFVLREELQIVEIDAGLLRRACELMEKYKDVPMDFADASLVAIAESRGMTRIFTLDSDFHIYRLKGRKAFQVIP